jgi:SAM-dependent methyltransferase
LRRLVASSLRSDAGGATVNAMIYHDWHARAGLGTSHQLVLGLVPKGSWVLDLGCSSGYLAEAMVQERASRVLGVEVDAEASKLARSLGIEVVDGSLTDGQTLAKVAARGPFNVVVAADVLEHLINWESVLDWIRDDLLASDGRLIASIPNVANYTVRKQLVMGKFDYTNRGILDDTHVRFFTASSLRLALQRHHFDIEEWHVAADALPLDDYFQRSSPLRSAKALINRWLLAHFPNLVAFQFVVSARPRRDGKPNC